ncbi:SCO family protein [Leptospira dzoumogneensis]|uniref:SCO family protein n=1 Tax=Leptospira dzoumogneensis TaxID=2484904 RepID=A0A4Z1AJS0_9LEPT|nr:SCO family protein [Leptospira dzoumogneensis]TGN03411.1 SCO family protein [Leptospira dzoumogneensis]
MGIRSYSKILFCSLVLFSIFTACTKDPKEEYSEEITDFSVPQKDKLPLYYGKDLQPIWENKNSSKPREISKFIMKDQEDQNVSEGHCKGKITVVSFFFTKCAGICPTITNNLSLVQKEFEADPNIQILSFSATPNLDSPQVLKEYGSKRKIRYEKWKLLTGNQKEIYALARDSFNADTAIPKEDAKKKLTENDFLHSDHVYLLDPQRRLRGIYNGKMKSSIQELNSDIEVLKREL